MTLLASRMVRATLRDILHTDHATPLGLVRATDFAVEAVREALAELEAAGDVQPDPSQPGVDWRTVTWRWIPR